MTQKYDVVLDARLGQRFGTLVLDDTGGDVKGSFFWLGFDDPVSGGFIDQDLELKHKLRTALSTLDRETHVKLRGDELFGVVKSQYSRMDLHGRKQEDGHKNEIPEQDRLSSALPPESLL